LRKNTKEQGVRVGLDETDLREMIQNSERDLSDLRNARLFVTGGTGYIGRWILEALCYADSKMGLDLAITVLSRKPDFFREQCPHLADHSGLCMIKGDVRDFEFPDGEFTHAIHGATDIVAYDAPLETFSVTVDGTRRVLDFCQKGHVKKVLLLSSGAVYGKIPAGLERVSEEYTGSPRTDLIDSAYGIGKLASEWLGSAYSGDGVMSCASARVFAQVGPYLRLDRHFAAGNFILNALRREPFLIKGDGTANRSYMYGTDLVAWLLAILVRGKAGRAFNVGSGHIVTIRELAAIVAKVASIRNPNITVLGKPDPTVPVERYAPDTSRARKELELAIKVPLEQALSRTIDWYRVHNQDFGQGIYS